MADRLAHSRFAAFRAACSKMRLGIRSGNFETIQAAWDELEQFLPFFMMKHEEEKQ